MVNFNQPSAATQAARRVNKSNSEVVGQLQGNTRVKKIRNRDKTKAEKTLHREFKKETAGSTSGRLGQSNAMADKTSIPRGTATNVTGVATSSSNMKEFEIHGTVNKTASTAEQTSARVDEAKRATDENRDFELLQENAQINAQHRAQQEQPKATKGEVTEDAKEAARKEIENEAKREERRGYKPREVGGGQEESKTESAKAEETSNRPINYAQGTEEISVSVAEQSGSFKQPQQISKPELETVVQAESVDEIAERLRTEEPENYEPTRTEEPEDYEPTRTEPTYEHSTPQHEQQPTSQSEPQSQPTSQQQEEKDKDDSWKQSKRMRPVDRVLPNWDKGKEYSLKERLEGHRVGKVIGDAAGAVADETKAELWDTAKSTPKALGRMVRKVAVGGTVGGAAAVAGLAVGVASGDPSKAAQYAGAGLAAGYYGSNYYADKAANAVGKKLKDSEAAFWGTDARARQNYKYDENFKKEPENITALANALNSRSRAREAMENGEVQAFLNNGITDIKKIGKGIKLKERYKQTRGMSDDASLKLAVSVAKLNERVSDRVLDSASREYHAFEQSYLDRGVSKKDIDDIIAGLEFLND